MLCRRGKHFLLVTYHLTVLRSFSPHHRRRRRRLNYIVFVINIDTNLRQVPRKNGLDDVTVATLRENRQNGRRRTVKLPKSSSLSSHIA